ncbi:mitochondrial inner membrane protease subunit 2-like [Oppia nitens]|uniref:mitochondrial inner membrane protease subunit 2-like n=1 Tax=Oppia nitens TaxID=1686743 RepID=UPI0023DA7F88|nr:mitochondrial inner membrane protease subunit 2-like [Oppia nitens]
MVSTIVASVRALMRSLAVTVPVTIVVTDCFGYMAKVDGWSMQPTFNACESDAPDVVLLSHWSARKFDVKRGQIVSLVSPREPNQLIIKRVVALEGDTVVTRPRYRHRTIIVPKGHCWVEGDNSDKSMDSNTFGCVPLGLISAICQYIIWPPKRWTKVEPSLPADRQYVHYSNDKCLVAFNTFDDYKDLDDTDGLSLIEHQ